MKHIHAELMVQYAQDAMEMNKPWERWEYKHWTRDFWLQATEDSMWSRHTEYRRKKTKVVDMSVLIESGIDCEFSDDGNTWGVGKLVRIKEPSSEEIEDGCVHPYIYYKNNSGLHPGLHAKPHRYCRPRMNHEHAWKGGECPLPEGALVNIYYRDDDEWLNIGVTSFKKWSHNGYPNDIIAFEVVGLVDGYVWSEEK